MPQVVAGAMPRHLPRTALVLIALFSTSAWAGDHVEAAVQGVGGASIAHPRTNAGVTLNPGAIGLMERYDIQGLFIGGPTKDLRWGVSAVDARTNEFLAFGLSYNGSQATPPFLPDELPGWALTDEPPVNGKQEHDITLALAGLLLDRKIGIGLNGTLQIFNNNFGGKGTTGNLDLGFAAMPVEYFSFGFAARDILPVPKQFDQPATLALGIRGGHDKYITASAEIDLRLEHVQDRLYDIRAGLEGSIRELVALRAGWDYGGDTGVHAATWSVGLFSTSGRIDYAMRIPANLDRLAVSDLSHYVTLTIFTKAFDRSEPEESPIRWEDGS